MDRRLRKAIAGLLSIVVMAASGGCWDAVEIENRALVLGLGFDEDAEGRVLVSAQVPTPTGLMAGIQGGGGITGKGASSAGAGSGNSFSVQSEGQTGFEAWGDLNYRLSRNMDTSQLQAIAIGEHLARSGIAKAVDLLYKTPLIPRSVWVVYTTDAGLLMATPGIQESMTSSHVANYFTTAKGVYGTPIPAPLWRFWVLLVTPWTSAYLPIVTVSGTALHFAGTAIFKGDRLAGLFNDHESAALALLTSQFRADVVRVSAVGNGAFGIHVTSAGLHLETDLSPEGRPEIRAVVRVRGRVMEMTDWQGKLDPDKLRAVADSLEERLSQDMKDVVRKAQDLGVDPFLFGDLFRAAGVDSWSPEWWWRVWPEAAFTVKVQAYVQPGRTTR